jgi:chromosome segregation ATPase
VDDPRIGQLQAELRQALAWVEELKSELDALNKTLKLSSRELLQVSNKYSEVSKQYRTIKG